MTTQTAKPGRIRRTVRSIREGWWLLCSRRATTIRGDWARYEADWHREVGPDVPLPKADHQRRNFALAWANLVEDLGGSRP